jgi:hypothetical protein
VAVSKYGVSHEGIFLFGVNGWGRPIEAKHFIAEAWKGIGGETKVVVDPSKFKLKYLWPLIKGENL